MLIEAFAETIFTLQAAGKIMIFMTKSHRVVLRIFFYLKSNAGEAPENLRGKKIHIRWGTPLAGVGLLLTSWWLNIPRLKSLRTKQILTGLFYTAVRLVILASSTLQVR